MKRFSTIFLAVAFAAIVAIPLDGRAASGIVGDWHFEEAGGVTITDASGNGNHGALGAASASLEPLRIADGKLGKALRFANDDYAFVEHSESLEPAHITVEAWVRSLPRSRPDTYSYVVAKSPQGYQMAAYALYTGQNGGIYFYVDGGGCMMTSSPSPEAIWDGAWHHVAGTFDGTAVRLYVDGAEVGTGWAYTGPIYYPPAAESNRRLFIGNYEFEYYSQMVRMPFRGDIDEVRIWSRALTPCEVAARALG